MSWYFQIIYICKLLLCRFFIPTAENPRSFCGGNNYLSFCWCIQKDITKLWGRIFAKSIWERAIKPYLLTSRPLYASLHAREKISPGIYIATYFCIIKSLSVYSDSLKNQWWLPGVFALVTPITGVTFSPSWSLSSMNASTVASQRAFESVNSSFFAAVFSRASSFW